MKPERNCSVEIGPIRHPQSHDARLRLLTNSPKRRNAAGIGLSFLDDVAALLLLRETHASEQHEWLRDGLGMVIAQLRQMTPSSICDGAGTIAIGCPQAN